MKRSILAVSLALLVAGCGLFKQTEPTPINITNTNTNTNNQNPPPPPVASPSPGVQGAGPIVECKVSFFTGSPGAGDKTMTVGERGSISLTPLNAQGIDPCKGVSNEACTVYSQADASWVFGDGASESDPEAVVQAVRWESNTYNLDVKAQNPGEAIITGLFRGGESVPPCSIAITVVAAR